MIWLGTVPLLYQDSTDDSLQHLIAMWGHSKKESCNKRSAARRRLCEVQRDGAGRRVAAAFTSKRRAGHAMGRGPL